MAATRLHLPAALTHFGPVPDASWAALFLAGFYLRRWSAWAFPLFMIVAVGVDYAVIHGQGIDFWQHYCVSAAYWFLLPAYAALWAGGALLAGFAARLSTGQLLLAGAGLLLAAVALCHLLSQGSFYWISDSVPQRSLAGWAQNYADWFLPFLRTTAVYVSLAVIAHTLAVQIARLAHAPRAAG
ncbi:MAG: hypothetical protein QM601_08320 [Pseudoxanthomonas sp.]